MTPEEAHERSGIALREAMLSLHEDLLSIKNQMLAINNQISDLRETIRNKWWIPIAVAALTSIATVIIARHH